MRLFLTICAISTFLVSGCVKATAPVEDLFFCDAVTERARFSQAEINLRQSNGFTRNLAWQYRINKHFDRECDAGSSE